MRKIKKEEIKDIVNMISDSPLAGDLVGGTGVLFFPIEAETQIQENEKGVLLHIENKKGSAKLVQVGVTINDPSDEDVVSISYASTEYAIPFDVEQHLSYFSSYWEQEYVDTLSELECFIVNKNSILIRYS